MAAQAVPDPVVLVISEDRRVRQALVTYLSAGGDSHATVTGAPYGDSERHAGGEVAVVCDLDGCDVDVALEAVAAFSGAGARVAALSASPLLRWRALTAGATAAVDKWSGIEEVARLVRSAVAGDRTGE